MRDAFVILSGAADVPSDDLDGLTPLQAAQTPALDRLAQLGRTGTVRSVATGYEPISEITTLGLLSYDPARYAVGTSVLLAAADGMVIEPGTSAVVCGAVTLDDAGHLIDPRAGGLRQAETEALLSALAQAVESSSVADAQGLEFKALRDGRALLLARSGIDFTACDLIDPALIIGASTRRHTPRGAQVGSLLSTLIALSSEVFAQHEVTLLRRELGERAPSQLWFWGSANGAIDPWPTFAHRHDARACLAARDLGVIGMASRMDIHVVEHNALEPIDTGPDALLDQLLRDALDAADHGDLLIVHVDDPLQYSHDRDLTGKIEAIERADRCIISLLLDRLGLDHESPNGRLGVCVDQVVRVSDAHYMELPVPFVMAGEDVACIAHQDRFDEPGTDQSDLHVELAHDLMEYFLKSGRRTAPRR